MEHYSETKKEDYSYTQLFGWTANKLYQSQKDACYMIPFMKYSWNNNDRHGEQINDSRDLGIGGEGG